MKVILDEVKSSVANWQQMATEIGISRNQQSLMDTAFRL